LKNSKVPASAPKLGAMQSPEGEREISAPGTASGTQPVDFGQPEVESAVAVATGQPEAAVAPAPESMQIELEDREPNFTLEALTRPRTKPEVEEPTRRPANFTLVVSLQHCNIMFYYGPNACNKK